MAQRYPVYALADLTIEIHVVGPAHVDVLAHFFEVLQTRGVDKHFHPHPLTAEAARERATYVGKDLYFVLLERNEVLGYAMLRGWDEGYEIPSLGIAIHPDAQGQGLGRLMIDFLRMAALRRGASKIRLRVCPNNQAAVALYHAAGYKLAREAHGQYLVGFLELNRR